MKITANKVFLGVVLFLLVGDLVRVLSVLWLLWRVA